MAVTVDILGFGLFQISLRTNYNLIPNNTIKVLDCYNFQFWLSEQLFLHDGHLGLHICPSSPKFINNYNSCRL